MTILRLLFFARTIMPEIVWSVICFPLAAAKR